MCRLYGVTRAGYYAWRVRVPSARADADAKLAAEIERIHRSSRRVYGSPRVHRTLRNRGVRVGAKRVARLMREHGIKARVARLRYGNRGLRRFFANTPNYQLEVTADASDQVWVGDITYLQAGDRWHYLAAVMDKWSRRIVGWSLGKHKDVRLTLRALNRAVANRHPRQGLIFHSDRGIEYAALAFRHRLAKLGFRQSMNRPGKMNDNAHMESFFHSMKAEVIHSRTFSDDRAIARMVKSYMPFYNGNRMHSALDYRAPVTIDRWVTDKCGVNKIG
jgi:putative transposase